MSPAGDDHGDSDGDRDGYNDGDDYNDDAYYSDGGEDYYK